MDDRYREENMEEVLFLYIWTHSEDHPKEKKYPHHTKRERKRKYNYLK